MPRRTEPTSETTSANRHRTRPRTQTRAVPTGRILAALAIGTVLLVIAPPVLRLAAAESSRQLEGVTPGSLDVTDVSFVNEVDQLSLAGQLFLPDTSGPHPAVVLINGSGPSVRSNSWYLTMSAHLVDEGFAVLWPDKRGSGRSDGDWRTVGFDALARDALASVDHLRSLPEVDQTRVGVVGMSQGGRIASIVASQDDDLAFAVSFVGGVLPAHESLRYEETHNLRQMGFLPGVSDMLARPSSWSIINIRQRDFWKAVGNFDPLPHWAQVDIAVLFQFGAADTNVDTAGSVERLDTLQRPNLRIKVYQGSGHTLEQPANQGAALIRPDALKDLTTFITDAANLR